MEKDLKKLESEDPFNAREWVTNCISLAEYFANECKFWT